MTDKKLTDNEIIRALECCSSGSYGCENGCPLDKECDSPIRGGEKIMKSALDLINRKDKEIWALREENTTLEDKLTDYRKRNGELIIELNRLQAENERLKAEVELLHGVADTTLVLPYVDCTECKRELQVKTYQHCLDKIQEYLKKRIPTDVYDELVEDFDNIYKVLEAELNER